MKAALRRVFRSTVVFAAAGLAGPLLRYVTWPPFDPESLWAPWDMFIYELVLLVWPTQPLAACDPTPGMFGGVLSVVGANVLLFAVLGALVSPLVRRGAWMLLSYATVCGLITWYGLLWTGFNAAYLHVPALLVALAFYSLPFWLLRRVAGVQSERREPSTGDGSRLADQGGTRGG